MYHISLITILLLYTIVFLYIDFVSPLHFVRSGNKEAYYDCCSETGQLSIYLPYKHNSGKWHDDEPFLFYSNALQ